MDFDEARYKHLEKIRDDTRDEIKKRIRQRDIYSIQLTIALATILGISHYNSDVIILVPLVSIYFTVLILYSYVIHNHLTTYLRTKIEPKFSNLLSLPVNIEIETYMKNEHKTGVRKYFFIIVLVTITIIVALFYIINWEIYHNPFKIISIIYIPVAFIIGIKFSLMLSDKKILIQTKLKLKHMKKK